MKPISVLLCLVLFTPLAHAQPAPSSDCAQLAYAAIASFEKYVDPGTNREAEWMETRCVRRGAADYHMELVANCNDGDTETTNLVVVSASFNPVMQCVSSANKNPKCGEYIPLAEQAISLSDEEMAAWENELTGICELYVYPPPE